MKQPKPITTIKRKCRECKGKRFFETRPNTLPICNFCKGTGIIKGADVTEYITNLLDGIEKIEIQYCECRTEDDDRTFIECESHKTLEKVKQLILDNLITEEK